MKITDIPHICFIVALQIMTLLLFVVAHIIQAWYYRSGEIYMDFFMVINGCFFNAIILQIIVILWLFIDVYHQLLKEQK